MAFMTDNPSADSRRLVAIDYTGIFAEWRDAFFPLLTVGEYFKRAGYAFLILSVWILIAILLAMVLTSLGLSYKNAIPVGILLPVIAVIALNVVGFFHHSQKIHKRTVKKLLDWISTSTGQRQGLRTEHISRATVDNGTTLCLSVDQDWLTQSNAKQLADLSHWCVIWCHCLGRYDGLDAVRILVTDTGGKIVGGTGSKGGSEIWITNA